jgi:outer membrane protein OmpA-like peptidoglycan-associated protein
MRIPTLIISLLSVLLLTNCAGGGFRLSQGPTAVQKKNIAVDRPVNRYGAQQPSASVAPEKKSMTPIVYEDVTIYPVDGDTTPYQDGRFDFTKRAPPTVAAAMNSPAAASSMFFFASGSSKLGAADVRQLKTLAKNICPTSAPCKIKVVGHASKGTAAQKKANLKIAKKRAEAVAAVLKKSGIDPQSISTVAQEDDRPDAKARRAEIFASTP